MFQRRGMKGRGFRGFAGLIERACSAACVLNVLFLCRRDAHADVQRVRAAAEDHAAQRADVAVVASPGEGDVAQVGQDVVGRIEIDPAECRAVDREPGVRRVGADQPRLARRRIGEQIAADVARRAARARAGRRSAGARSPGRRRAARRARGVTGVVIVVAPGSNVNSRVDAVHQVDRRREQRPAGRERRRARSRRAPGRSPRRATRSVNCAASLGRRAAAVDAARRGPPPRRARRERSARPVARHRDDAAARPRSSVCGVSIVNWSTRVAEVVDALRLGWPGAGSIASSCAAHALARQRARRQVRDVLRRRHAAGVDVAGLVLDAVARPLIHRPSPARHS